MKKIALLLLSAVLALSLTGCTAKVTPSFAPPTAWRPGAADAEVYEQAVYRLDRYAVASAEDRLNPTGTTVAGGELTVTLQNCADPEFPECLELVQEYKITFIQDSFMPSGIAAVVGDTLESRSRVVFSVGTSSIMETRFAEKRVVASAEPRINLDYTADYRGGLRVTSYALGEEGERLQNADGTPKTTVYSFKAKKVAAMYDNDQWMLMNRYASDFKAGWSGSYQLISIPEIIYNDGKLAAFNLSATSTEEVLRNLGALDGNGEDGNIKLSETDDFADKDSAGNFTATCTDVSIVNAGSMNVNRGPILYASYITTRSVENLRLANLLVQYAQNEYSTAGVMRYSTVARLQSATVTPPAEA